MGFVIMRSYGRDIRNPDVRFRLYHHRVGPVGTMYDYWIVGFRALSLFVFLQRYSWGQMRLTVEWRSQARVNRAWRWWRANKRPAPPPT